jgi:hypothetical protein
VTSESKHETAGDDHPKVAEQNSRSTLGERVSQWLEIVFAIDPRSLGLFRICFGLALVPYLMEQTAILEEVSTDAGSLPRALHHQFYSSVERWSLHLWGGSFAFAASLYALTAGAIVAFTVGYRTRWATLLLWVLLTSLHNRHPMFGTASDSVRRMMLFWGFFLPLGCRFSLDRRAGRDATPRAPIVRIASAAILLQILFIYIGAGFSKDYETWVHKGTATILALRLDLFATRLGKALLDFPLFLKATSIFTWWIENVVPFLLLLPLYNARLRLLAIAVFYTLHAGLYLTMELSSFPYTMMAVWTIFLPPSWWSWLASLPGRSGVLGSLGSRGETVLAAMSRAFPRRKPKRRSGRPWVENSFGKLVVACALTLVVLWNVETIGRKLNPDFPRLIVDKNVVKVMSALRLTQSWEVFSPHPSRKDGWLVVVATLRDGSQVDLFRDGQPVNYTKPAHVADLYKNTRWSKYTSNLFSSGGRKHRKAYATMFVRRWNARHPESRWVQHVELVQMVEWTRPDLSEAPLQKEIVWQGDFPSPPRAL